MTFLLDVNLLLAAIIESHPHHAAAGQWLAGKPVALCPLSELGFLRISTNTRVFNLTMETATAALEAFRVERRTAFIPDDVSASVLKAKTSEQVTDSYLAELADRHEMRLATFDSRIAHAAAEVISAKP